MGLALRALGSVLLVQGGFLAVGCAAGRLLPRLRARWLGRFVWYAALPALLFRSTLRLDLGALEPRFLAAMLGAKWSLALLGALASRSLLPGGSRLKSAGLAALLLSCSNDLAFGFPLMGALDAQLAAQVVVLSALQNVLVNPLLFIAMDIGAFLERRAAAADGGAPPNAVADDEQGDALEREQLLGSGAKRKADADLNAHRALQRGCRARGAAADIALGALRQIATNPAILAVSAGCTLNALSARGTAATALPPAVDAALQLVGALFPALANAHVGLLLTAAPAPSREAGGGGGEAAAGGAAADAAARFDGDGGGAAAGPSTPTTARDDDSEARKRRAEAQRAALRLAWRAPVGLACLKMVAMPALATALCSVALGAALDGDGAARAAAAASKLVRFGWIYAGLPSAPWLSAFAQSYEHYPAATSRTVAASSALSVLFLAVSVALLFADETAGSRSGEHT